MGSRELIVEAGKRQRWSAYDMYELSQKWPIRSELIQVCVT